jgi:hypothetical protein
VPFQEAAFWVGLEMFGAGIYSFFEQKNFFVAAAFTLIGIGGMSYSVYKNHYPTTNLPSLAAWIWVPLVVITAVFLIYDIYARTSSRTQPPVSLAPTEIYMDCHQISLPIHIPPMMTAHIKAFNKKQYGNTKQAMFDIRNDGSKEKLWPDSKLINSVKFNPGVFGYECDVANHAQSSLIDLAIQLTTNLDNVKEPLIYTAIISPLDAGTTFSFYLINECPATVSVISPDAATVQVFGEDKRRTIPLHWPHRNPIEQIMLFFPSKVAWTGNSCG